MVFKAEVEKNKCQKTLLWAGCCERGRGVDLYQEAVLKYPLAQF